MIYNKITSKYKEPEKNFGAFMSRSLVRFEHEMTPLHTIVYGGTATGKTCFVRQHLKLYQDQDQDQGEDQEHEQGQEQDPKRKINSE